MATISMKNLLESGVHFGHQTRRWNPKMKRYIFTARNGIHIINLQKTIQLAKESYEAMRDFSAQGKKILFVGTKKQAQTEIKRVAEQCGMPYVTNRWLGGLLTNFQTVKQSTHRLKKLEEAFANDTIHEIVKTKKEILILKRELSRLQKDLGGISDLNDIPDALFIIDPEREKIAVQEAVKLKIPIFALVDTNCDPEPITYPIPANDDAIRAISLFLDIMVAAIEEGKQGGDFKNIEIEDSIDIKEHGEHIYDLDKIKNIEEIEQKYDISRSFEE